MSNKDPASPTYKFNKVLSTIQKNKTPKNNDNVVDSYNEMEKKGIGLDIVSYNILMNKMQ